MSTVDAIIAVVILWGVAIFIYIQLVDAPDNIRRAISKKKAEKEIKIEQGKKAKTLDFISKVKNLSDFYKTQKYNDDSFTDDELEELIKIYGIQLKFFKLHKDIEDTKPSNKKTTISQKFKNAKEKDEIKWIINSEKEAVKILKKNLKDLSDVKLWIIENIEKILLQNKNSINSVYEISLIELLKKIRTTDNITQESFYYDSDVFVSIAKCCRKLGIFKERLNFRDPYNVFLNDNDKNQLVLENLNKASKFYLLWFEKLSKNTEKLDKFLSNNELSYRIVFYKKNYDPTLIININ